MAARSLTVFIYLPGRAVAVPAGVFTHDPALGVGNFVYGRRYLQRAGALAADPVSLPLGRPPQATTLNNGLYGAFRDAAPDLWGRLVIAAESGVAAEAMSEVDYLLAANASRVGNLDFRLSPKDGEPDAGPPHFSTLDGIMDAAAQVEAGQGVQGHLLRLLRQGSSLGGARPKCAVEWRGAMWVAKFPSQNDTVNMARVEYAAMTLAGQCGIGVPEVRVETMAGRDVYLARRFDREASDSGWLRQGFVSALTLAGWDEADRAAWSYPALADAMRRHAPAPDVAELFRRMAFNILARNMDDHPRNHGFLVGDDGGLRLSPAYDIVPALARAGVNDDFGLAMGVGEHGRQATLANALSLAARFGLGESAAREMIAGMLETVRDWRGHFEACGVSGADLDRLGPSFARCDETI